MVKVLVAGFKGRMGNTTVQMVLEHEDFELVGVFDPCAKEKNLNENAEYKDTDVPVYVSREEIKTDAEVWIDFTAPSAVFENAKFALENHISPVIGTTGMSDDQVAELQALAKKNMSAGSLRQTLVFRPFC